MKRPLAIASLAGLRVAVLAAQARAGPQLTDPGKAAALAERLDPIIAQQMDDLHVPGLALVVVQDNAVVLAKGYGYAELSEQRPVAPHRTVFRLASVSKLFTATAVMQLVERGKLDLDADVNRYLRSFKLPDSYEAPITAAHLLTHTGGLEPRTFGHAVAASAPAEPLGAYLARRMPPRVMPPGRFISYSNHGYALLGHLVELVSGVPFARYAEEHILGPLDMRRSSFGLPPELAADLAVGYRVAGGRHRASAFEALNVAPAGALNATVADVAKFAIAHLAEGRFRERRVLAPATTRLMQRQQFAHHPEVGGYGYGFEIHPQYPRRAIGHGGSLSAGWGSLLMLFPDERLGVVLAYNREHTPALGRAVLDAVLDRQGHRVAPRASPKPTSPSPERARRFGGTYRDLRHARRSLEKLELLRGRMLQVVDNDDGSLTVAGERFVEARPLLFKSASGTSGPIAFGADDHGRIAHLFVQRRAYERLPWWETRPWQRAWLALCAGLFLGSGLYGPVEMLRQRRRAKRPSPRAPEQLSRSAVFLGSTLNLAFIAIVALAWPRLGRELAHGLPGWLALLLAIPNLAVLWAAVVAALTVRAWTRGREPLGRRIQLALATAAAWAFVPWLGYWNLIGWRY